MLDHKDRQLQQMRQRIRELEQDELQKRMCEMERENQLLSQRLKCKICQVEEVQVLLSPCNHLVCCQNCVPNLPQDRCPICARIIQSTIMGFFAWVIFYFLNTITYVRGCWQQLPVLSFILNTASNIILLFQWMKENCCCIFWICYFIITSLML